VNTLFGVEDLKRRTLQALRSGKGFIISSPELKYDHKATGIWLQAVHKAGQKAYLENRSVGAPGFGESLIPVWGSGRSAIHAWQTGDYQSALFWTAFVLLDIAIVGALIRGGVKIIGQGGIKALGAEVARTAPSTTRPLISEGVEQTLRMVERPVHWGPAWTNARTGRVFFNRPVWDTLTRAQKTIVYWEEYSHSMRILNRWGFQRFIHRYAVKSSLGRFLEEATARGFARGWKILPDFKYGWGYKKISKAAVLVEGGLAASVAFGGGAFGAYYMGNVLYDWWTDE